MKPMKYRLPLFLSLLLTLLVPAAEGQLQELGDGGPGPVKAQHLTVELVTLSPAIAPGGTQQVGIVITLEEHWHVYWINAGDAGLPPGVKWTLPTGLTAGPMQFAIPSRLPNGPLMDFGYEDTAAFPVLISAAQTAKPGPAHLDARVNWLVCREVCIPGKAHLGIDLNVTPGATPGILPGTLVGALGTAVKSRPRPLPAGATVSILGGKSDFVITLTTGAPDSESDPEFYPFDPDQIIDAADQSVDRLPTGLRVHIARAEDPDHPGVKVPLPASLHGLLKLSDEEAYDITAPVVPGEAPAAAPNTAATQRASSSAGLTALSAILLAFLGGIILNLMPCVFPVLFLKGLALVQSSGSEERNRLRAHGLVYTLGILVSFWAIVAALLHRPRRRLPRRLGLPAPVSRLPRPPRRSASSSSPSRSPGSSRSASLSPARAASSPRNRATPAPSSPESSPRSSPLPAPRRSWASPSASPSRSPRLSPSPSLPRSPSASPRLTSCSASSPHGRASSPVPAPGWRPSSRSPRVPFFATVIWLTYVYGALFTGPNAGTTAIYRVALLLLCFLILTIAGWILGKWPARWSGTLAAAAVALLALAVPLYQPKDVTTAWQPYTRQTLDAARAAGHPVFIDFTAAWCLSCQVNERLVLRSAEVQHQFAANHVTLLKADWTQYDPAITAELQSIHRSGVPTYVLYPHTPASPADVLPELLTKSLVLDALKRDTN